MRARPGPSPPEPSLRMDRDRSVVPRSHLRLHAVHWDHSDNSESTTSMQCCWPHGRISCWNDSKAELTNIQCLKVAAEICTVDMIPYLGQLPQSSFGALCPACIVNCFCISMEQYPCMLLCKLNHRSSIPTWTAIPSSDSQLAPQFRYGQPSPRGIYDVYRLVITTRTILGHGQS